MPKPKLSAQQKAALRREIKKKLKKGQTKNAVMTNLAPKYKISTETVRYYINGMNGHPPKRKKGRKASRPQNGALRTALRSVGELSVSDMEKLLRAKKLQADFQAMKDREKELQRQLRSLQTDQRRVAKRIQKALR